jgi:hypothetical protein
VVGEQQGPAVRGQPGEQVFQRGDGIGVQRRPRLVQDDQPDVSAHGLGQPDLLQVAGGQRGERGGPVAGEAEVVEHRGGAVDAPHRAGPHRGVVSQVGQHGHAGRLDPSSASLARRLTSLAAGATDEFLVYYAGRVLRSAAGELTLAVRPTGAHPTGLGWAIVAAALRSCRAKVCRVILDCVVAGDGVARELDGPSVADLAAVDGVYTLVGARPLPGAKAGLSFTDELVDLVRAGLPGEPARLSLSALHPWLCRRLLAQGSACAAAAWH